MAQNAVSPATTTTSTTPTTTTTAPLPNAPNLLASEAYPTLRVGFDSGRVNIINQLVSRLNITTHIATNGQFNFFILKNNNFSFDPSSVPSPDQKNLLLFFQKTFHALLNSGNTFSRLVSAAALTNSINYLLQAPELSQLSQINATGNIAQKMPGDFKEAVRNLLTRLMPSK